MATYAIGDIQGCYDPFMQLLERIRFDPARDRLWLVGDLVNRGPKNVEVLRFLVRHRDAVDAVLGNHDIYALARAFAATRPTDDETLLDFVSAPDRDELVAWLVSRPILFEGSASSSATRETRYAMVHAGVLPAWDMSAARREARHVEAALGADPAGLLNAYFNRKRSAWSTSLAGSERAASALGVFTRIRFVDDEGRFVSGSGAPEKPPVAGAVPWFRKRPIRTDPSDPIFVFGHWASLGLWMEDGVMALDSGCVWNCSLTAVRLEDRAVFAVPNRRDEDG